MNARTLFLVGVIALALSACPPPTPQPDGGQDAGGGNNTLGPCTGGCGPNQLCDLTTHQCVDGCGGCDAGTCVKNPSGAFQCVATATACNNTLCASGQAACLAGTCSCLPFTRASRDTCAVEGAICNGSYNPATSAGGTCDAPKLYEACRTTDCPSGTCAACPAGAVCASIYPSLDNICVKTCTATNQCNRGELCSQDGCLPKGVFGDKYNCANKIPKPDAGVLDDGGVELITVDVPVSNTCLLKDEDGNPTQAAATGNCSYEFWRFSNQVIPIANCRNPGGAGLGATCSRDTSNATVALQCDTGLECALTRDGTGQCLKMCNASTPRLGFTPQPACGTDEACVNIYRLDDLNAVVGVCMKSCDVFSTTSGACADVGAEPASCVPVPADGRALVGLDGSGICVPQKAAVANVGEVCAETDPFKGAACASGLVCRVAAGANSATCAQPCDVSCAVASPPARCATQPNATCAGGKTCEKVTSTTGATLGFCSP